MQLTTLACIAAFLLIAAITYAPMDVQADIPVHCLWNETAGNWKFTLSKSNLQRDEALRNCAPDQPFVNSTSINIELAYPNIVNQDGAQVGTWTLVWDQGFELIISGVRYFAYFYYTKNGQDVVSHCGTTFTGYFYTDNGPATQDGYGCFSGERTSGVVKKAIAASKFDTNLVGEKLNDADLIKAVNEDKSIGWTAAAYKHWEGLTTADLDRIGMGGRRIPAWRWHAIRDAMASFRATVAKINAAKPMKMAARQVKEELDWRNVDGQNYVTPVLNQGSCGSCYIFGSMGQFACRHRIKTKNADQTVFSQQDVLQCGNPIYAQGCEGGMQLLMGKYFYELGALPDKCKPYTARDGSCPAYSNRWGCDSKPTYVKSYQYTGGYYGASNEQNLLEALQDGPVTAALNVLRDFFAYRGGIYRHKKTTTADNEDPPFFYVNHSILIVGSGVSKDGVKYWIGRNSWGAKWGLEGYFMIVRGTDEVAIESCAVEMQLA